MLLTSYLSHHSAVFVGSFSHRRAMDYLKLITNYGIFYPLELVNVVVKIKLYFLDFTKSTTEYPIKVKF